MAKTKEDEIELIFRVMIDSAIKIIVTRLRSTNLVQKNIAFAANSHFAHLGIGLQAPIDSSGIIGFEPTGKQKPWISVKY